MKGSGEAFDLLAESAGESESSTSPKIGRGEGVAAVGGVATSAWMRVWDC